MGGIIPKDPLNEPVDWARRLLTIQGEVQIKFAVYVQSETTSQVPSSFPFQRLPVELQLRILQFCTQATLFQLMHVSSTIRHEAKKLFWGNPDAWYRVSGKWLLEGGFAGDTWDAVDFLANVQQVELVFDCMDYFFGCEWVDEHHAITFEEVDSPFWLPEADKQICDIWQSLQAKCPQLTRVLISEGNPRMHTAPPHRAFVKILNRCPANIGILGISYGRWSEEIGGSVQRCMWQKPKENEARNWNLVDADSRHESILPPPKDFRGPVGAFQQWPYHLYRTQDYERSLRQLNIDAIERHYFVEQHYPFTCPEPRCNARFDHPGQWPRHAAKQNHIGRNLGFIPEITTQVKPLMERSERYLRQKFDAMMLLIAEGSAAGTEQKRIAEDAFLHQLETDPLFKQSKPARESSLWKRYGLDIKEKDW